MHPKITSSKVYDMSSNVCVCVVLVLKCVPRAGRCGVSSMSSPYIYCEMFYGSHYTHTCAAHTYLVFSSFHSCPLSMRFEAFFFRNIHVSDHNVASLESGMFVRMYVWFVHVVHDFLKTHSARNRIHTDIHIHTHIPYTLCHVLFNYHTFV